MRSRLCFSENFLFIVTYNYFYGNLYVIYVVICVYETFDFFHNFCVLNSNLLLVQNVFKIYASKI